MWLKRIVGLLKWGIFAFVLLLALDGILSAIIAGSNQDKIDAFYEEVDSNSYWRFLKQTRKVETDGFIHNGWYLWLGAISSISSKALETAHMDPKTLKPDLIALREGELDRAHALILEAEKAPYTMAVTMDGDPLAASAFPVLRVCEYARIAVASASMNLEKGETAKGAQRYLDSLKVMQVSASMPLLISYMALLGNSNALLISMGSKLQQLPTESLPQLIADLGETDLKEELSNAVRGEAFYSLYKWDELTTQENWQYCPFFPLKLTLGESLLELDKAVYLDIILPLAKAPTRKNAGNAMNPPFYAGITSASLVDLNPLLTQMENVIAKKAVILECLRMEMIRHKTGVWPELQKEIQGVLLEMKKTEKGVEIITPLQGAPDFKVTLSIH